MQYVLCKSMENSPQTNPIIGRIDTKSGHGAGRPTQKLVSYYFFVICFFYMQFFSDFTDLLVRNKICRQLAVSNCL